MRDRREYERQWRLRNRERVAAQRRAYADRATSALATIKLERGCVDCGYDRDPRALDFDHVRGEKLFNLSHARARYSLERLLEEVDKCEVRCANCHRVKTWAA